MGFCTPCAGHTAWRGGSILRSGRCDSATVTPVLCSEYRTVTFFGENNPLVLYSEHRTDAAACGFLRIYSLKAQA